jgi:hypothetical protein
MPLTVTCEECSASHRVKDDAVGKKFKCRGCGKTLVVVAPPPEDDFGNFDEADFADDEADDAYGEYLPKASKRKTTPKKSAKTKSGKSKPVPIHRTKVPLGIDLVYFGFLAYILIVLLTMVLPLTFAWNLANRDNIRTLLSILWWLNLATFVTTTVTTVGKLMCLTAPRQMIGRETIFVAVAIDLLPWLTTVASWITVVSPLLKSAINVVSVAGFVCFLLFLRYLGDFLGERDLRERATGIFKLGIGCVALWMLQLGLAAFNAGNAKDMPLDIAGRSMGAALLGITCGIVMIILVIRYVGLLSSCRYALANA